MYIYSIICINKIECYYIMWHDEGLYIMVRYPLCTEMLQSGKKKRRKNKKLFRRFGGQQKNQPTQYPIHTETIIIQYFIYIYVYIGIR